MLISFALSNFKSHEDATLPLGTLTVLIGQNASGKSNLLEGLRLLGSLARGRSLDSIEAGFREEGALVRGDARDLFLDGDRPFSLGVDVADDQRVDARLSLSIEQRDGSLRLHDERMFDTAEEKLLYEREAPPGDIGEKIPYFYQIRFPDQMSGWGFDEARSARTATVNNRVRETLAAIHFLSPRPARMRGYVSATKSELREDASNLSAALHHLVDTRGGKEALLGFVESLPEQSITDMDFIETARDDVMVRLRERFGREQCWRDAPLLSDGTLRVLAIAAALLGAKAGSLLVIEDIDDGVHPSRTGSLMARVRRIAKERELQVLMTSHNPALLNTLEDESLSDTVCCFRDEETGYSRLTRLGELDNFAELAARGPLGELMTRRLVERFVKERSTPEDRRRAAREWLAKSRTGS